MRQDKKAKVEEDAGQEIERLIEELSYVTPLQDAVARTGRILGRVLVQRRLGSASEDDVEAARAAHMDARGRREEAALMLEAARVWIAARNEHRVQLAQSQQDEERATRRAAYESALEQFKELLGTLTLPREKPRLDKEARKLWASAHQAGKVANLRKYFETLENRRGLEHLASW